MRNGKSDFQFVLLRIASFMKEGMIMRRIKTENGQPIIINTNGSGLFRKIGNVLTGVLAGVGVIVILGLVFGWWSSGNTIKRSGSKEAILAEETKFHDIILTNTTVKSELNAIAELMTYSETYSGMATVVDSRQIPYTDINIWGTQHQIQISYVGTIKVGYDLNDLHIMVNDTRKEIYITLPSVPIVDNNLPQENVTILQDNNLLNPIRADEVNEHLVTVKAEQLQNAVNNGIYDKAETHLRKIIVDNLAKLHNDYKVVFSTNSAAQ